MNAVSPSPIYLDHAATTPVHPDVLEAMMPWLTNGFGNASSLYRLGRQARKAFTEARETLATLIGSADPESILWTSGGTESDNMAVKGVAFGLQSRGKHLITSATEHPAVLEPCRWLAQQGWELTVLPVDSEGRVDPQMLEAAIRPDTVLVSIMHGNNEIGTLQPIVELGAIAQQHGVLFHTDAVQTVGKFAFDLKNLPINLVSASSHKLYGPKGVGLLYADASARNLLTPWLQGGGQQEGFRSGTENLAGIIGFTQALQRATTHRETHIPRLLELQGHLISGIRHAIPDAVLNGPSNLQERVPGNVNFSFPPIEGESLVLRLDMAGIAVSSGSACHSGQMSASDVILATGATPEIAKSSLRFSLGIENTPEELDSVLDRLPGILEKAGYFRTPPNTATIK